MAKKGILKKLVVLFIGFIAVIGIGLFVLVLNLDSIIGGSIEKFGTDATGTGVTIENVSLSIFSGNLSLDGLEVKNPEGFVNPHAFKFEKFAVDIDLASLVTDTIVINSIIIKDIRIAYEPSTGGSNLDRIQKNVEKYTGADKKSTEPAQKDEPAKTEGDEAPQKNIIIKKFIIDGGEIAVASPILGTGINVPMAKFEMNDIGTGGKSSASEVFNQIFEELLPAIARSVSDGSVKGIKGLGKVGDDLDESTKGGFSKIKSLFSK
ncbi:MAG: hypothetical protein L3J71_08500 [Victivallaceae bacterium]|nr:hypothetical protein [Victivallaceae bacterium]